MLGLGNSLVSRKGATPYANESSLYFDGTGDYLDTGATFQSTIRGSFSMSFWVKVTDGQPSSIVRFFGSEEGSSDEDELRLEIGTDGKLSCWFEADGTYINATSAAVIFDDGVNPWKHIVLTIRKNTSGNSAIALWVNGTTTHLTGIGTIGTMADTVHNSFTTGNNLWIGGFNGDGSLTHPVTGNIDEFAIWDVALSLSEVVDIYNGGSPENLLLHFRVANLVAWYRMGDGTEAGTGSTVYDMSTNSNNATITNAVYSTSIP